MVAVALVWAGGWRRGISARFYAWHTEDTARSAAVDWLRRQEDIWGPICWRKIRHLSSWSLQIRAQSSFSAPSQYSTIPGLFCFSHYHPKVIGGTSAFQFTTNKSFNGQVGLKSIFSYGVMQDRWNPLCAEGCLLPCYFSGVREL